MDDTQEYDSDSSVYAHAELSKRLWEVVEMENAVKNLTNAMEVVREGEGMVLVMCEWAASTVRGEHN